MHPTKINHCPSSIAFSTSSQLKKAPILGEHQCETPITMAIRNGLKQMSVRSVNIAKKTHPTGYLH